MLKVGTPLDSHTEACMVQAEGAKSAEGVKEAFTADARVAVSVLAKAEQCASEVLVRLGQSHSMALLLEGQAASVAAQLPEMQARPLLSHHCLYLGPFLSSYTDSAKNLTAGAVPQHGAVAGEPGRFCGRAASQDARAVLLTTMPLPLGCEEPSPVRGPSKLYDTDRRQCSRGLTVWWLKLILFCSKADSHSGST